MYPYKICFGIKASRISIFTKRVLSFFYKRKDDLYRRFNIRCNINALFILKRNYTVKFKKKHFAFRERVYYYIHSNNLSYSTYLFHLQISEKKCLVHMNGFIREYIA